MNKLVETVTHELRVPLTAIKNSVYFMKMMAVEERNPKIADHMSLINNRIDNCVQIITNMNAFVEPKAPIKKEIQLNDIITDSLSQALMPSNIKVRTAFDEEMPLIMADPFQMRLVFDNLVRNAVSAMKMGGELTVKATHIKDGVVIEFEDTGVGIPPENLDKIFDPLFSTTPHGIGLGLAVSRQIVESHGGIMEVVSRLNEGATFGIKLQLG